ncbi:TonB-dependent receptor domain-containing protein [Arenimonas caeni]|nr:TonB-dependent receptor [Arenimonas caeni]
MLSIAIAAALASTATAASPATLPQVEVIGRATPDAATETVRGQDLRESAPGDLAELLRAVNGVSAGRMGGHGLEPVIRGQSQGQLNVRTDGGLVVGACPNRMDPPSAFTVAAAVDRVTVVKGVQSLAYGAGGTGGTILVERGLPWTADAGGSVRAGAGAGDNGLDWRADSQLLWRGERAALRLDANAAEYGDYVDGDGEAVRSGFRRRSLHAMAGHDFGDAGVLEIGVERAETLDGRFAGAGMDAPLDRMTGARLAWQRDLAGGELSVRAWRNEVDHVMDNFSLRPQPAMAMRTPAESDTQGGDLRFETTAGAWSLSAGLDLSANRRQATRFAGPGPAMLTMVNAFLWPDARLDQAGLYGEGSRPLGEGTLTAGLRVDRFRAEARRADVRPSPMAMAPSAFYAMYYGSTEGRWDDTGVSGLLRFEREVSDGLTAFAGISRTVRAADATERYLAAPAAIPSGRWIGNPGLALEKHSQLDLGLAWEGERATASAVAFVDRVGDYILRDRARGQDGVLLADGASVYRNVDASLHGLELEARWQLTESLALETELAWVRGQNRSDDRPLAQMPPLNGALALAWETRTGEWTARLRGAARQDRVDDSVLTGSGLDARRTPGFGVLDLGWSKSFGAHRLRLDLKNVSDRTYAEHLNRANLDPFNPDPVQVNEPGRGVFLAWEWTPGG